METVYNGKCHSVPIGLARDGKCWARSIVEEHISEGYNGWVVDDMAGWIETGDIEKEEA
jgi:hypothetical protein